MKIMFLVAFWLYGWNFLFLFCSLFHLLMLEKPVFNPHWFCGSECDKYVKFCNSDNSLFYFPLFSIFGWFFLVFAVWEIRKEGFQKFSCFKEGKSFEVKDPLEECKDKIVKSIGKRKKC